MSPSDTPMQPDQRSVIKIRRAPWHRRFPTLWCAGSVAYELQIGPAVIQWFYKRPTAFKTTCGRLHVWKDRFWR